MSEGLAREIFWIQLWHMAAFIGVLAFNYRFYLLSRKTDTLYRYLQVQACLLLWILAKILKTISPDVDIRWCWIVAQYAGVSLLGPSFAHFAISYAGRSATRPLVAAYAIGGGFFASFASNPAHMLYYRRYTFYGDSFGPIFYAHMAFTYGLILIGIAVSASAFRSRRRKHNGTSYIAFAAMGPLLINALYVSRVIRPLFDPTPLSMSAAILLFAWAALRHNFLGVIPLRGEDLILAIPNPVLIRDRSGSVIYSNRGEGALLDGYACHSRLRRRGNTIELYANTARIQELKRRYRENLRVLSGTHKQLQHNRGRRMALYRSRLWAGARRDLHDLLGHSLTLILLLLRSALVQAGKSEADAKVTLAAALYQAKKARMTLSDGSIGMDATPDPDGRRLSEASLLTEAIHPIIEAFERCGLRIEARLDGRERFLEPKLVRQLVSCIQEGLTNAVKHGAPDSILLAISFMQRELAIRLVNDGDVPEGFRPGEGLRMMKDRIKPWGGTLRAYSEPGQGFILSLSLPLAD